MGSDQPHERGGASGESGRAPFAHMRAALASMASRVRAFVSSTEFTHAAGAAYERRVWGQRGHGQGAMFWTVTIWTSAAMGACSALNGFSPFDLVLRALGHPGFYLEGTGALVRYVVTAVIGSAAFNVFVAQRHELDGYAKGMYLGSVVSGVMCITLSQAGFAYLWGGWPL